MNEDRKVNLTERLALYVAVLAAGSAFAILFSEGSVGGFGGSSLLGMFGGGAFGAFFGAALAGTLVGSAGRFRLVLLPPAAVFYTVLAVYGLPRPTPSGIEGLIGRIGEDLFGAANIMYVDPVPYAGAPGLFVVFIPIVMIICAFATSAALYERAPLISVATLGLTIGVLSTISFEDGAGPFFFIFVLASMVLILFSGVAGESRSMTGVGLVAALLIASAVLALPKMPLASAAVSSGSIDWTRIGTGGTSRLDVQADVGEYLNSGREAELMRVSSTEPLYWRGGTLDSFDGVRWSNTTDEESGSGYGEEVADGISSRSVVQSFEVLQSETDLVFGGYRISGLSNEVSGATPNADGSWSATEPLTEGDEYRVLSEVPQPSAAQLSSSGGGYPADVREKYLVLLEETPEVVAETAQQVQANYDTSTPYATSRAVERYLSTDGDFTYNLEVDYRRADWAIEEFLGEGREGFCTQFATSMALILREMDVPSRVVYGATTGDQIDENVYLVRGANMHTWVEVYFPGVGWYPFDPTPGFSMPETMQSNVPRLDPSLGEAAQNIPQENQNLENPEEQEDLEPLEPVQEEESSPATAQAGGRLPVWPLLAFGMAAVIGVVPLTKLMLFSRGRAEDYYRDVVGRLTDSLPPGATVDLTSLTVEERLTLLAGASGLDPEPFEGLATTYSAHLYAPGTEGNKEISRAYRRAMAEYRELPAWKRMLAALNPTSLLSRGGRRGRRILGGVAKAVRIRIERLRRGS
ncbi:MAG: transglutaminaseTgpA domain-containing protein [Rubrobacter sp.]